MSGKSMHVRRLGATGSVAVALALVLAVMVSAGSAAGQVSSTTRWVEQFSAPDINILGVEALDQTNVWAAGSLVATGEPAAALFHYDGAAWTLQESGMFTGEFWRISACHAPGDGYRVWAVGQSLNGEPARIYHDDGTGSWTRQGEGQFGDTTLHNVISIDPDNVVVVGVEGDYPELSGKVFATADGGSTWNDISPGVIPGYQQVLLGVDAVDATAIWAVGMVLAVDGSSYHAGILHYDGDSWTYQAEMEFENAMLVSVSCADADTVMAAGTTFPPGEPQYEGVIITTTDGGENWSRDASAILEGSAFHDIVAVTPNAAWATGFYLGPDGEQEYGNILHYDGEEWTRQAEGEIENSRLFGVTALDEDTVWTSGTSDEGTGIILKLGGYAFDIDPMMDGQHGYPGDTVTYSVELTNTGSLPDSYDIEAFTMEPWEVVVDPETLEDIAPGESASVEMIVGIPPGASYSSMGFVMFEFTSRGDTSLAEDGLMITMIPGTYCWAAEETGTSGDLRGLTAADEDSFWGVGFNTEADPAVILKWNPAEEKWDRQESPGGHALTSIAHHDRDLLWAAGLSNTILKTEDGGEGWLDRSPPGGPVDFYSIDAADEDTVWAVGSSMNIWRSTDSGQIWLPQAHGLPAPGDMELRGVCAPGPSAVWVAGYSDNPEADYRGMVAHYNGTTWEEQFTVEESGLNAVCALVDEDEGESLVWAAGDGGSIFFSEDGGENWVRQDSGTTGNLYAITLSEDGVLWAAGENGWIMFSLNLGRNWLRQESGHNTLLRGVQSTDMMNVRAAGENGLILKGSPAEFGVELTASGGDDSRKGNPGELVEYRLLVKNTGCLTDGFDGAATEGPGGWGVSLEPETVENLEPGAVAEVTARVHIPPGASGDDSDISYVEFSSWGDHYETDVLPLYTSLSTYEVDLFAPKDSSWVRPGGTAAYNLEVTNQGSGSDTFSSSVSGASWVTVVSPASVTLGPGESTTVTVRVNVPAEGAKGGDEDTARVAFTSTGDPARPPASDWIDFSTLAKYSVSAGISPSGAGTVTGQGYYSRGETATLAAGPEPGYRFGNWTENEAVVSDENPWMFKVHSDRDLLANFSADDSTWYLAEGTNAWGFNTYISITNPDTSPVKALITWMDTGPSGPGNGVAGTREVYLPALSQTTVSSVEDIGEIDFSTMVECPEGRQIAVDRTMYWTGEGMPCPGAHSSIGAAAPSETWYLPEGSSLHGLETWITVQNPNDTEANLALTYMTEDAGPILMNRQITPRTRATYSMAADIGEHDSAIAIVSDVPVIAERSMYSHHRREGTSSVGAAYPAGEWYLAEGTSAWGFTTYLCLQNPNATPAGVNLVFQTPEGPIEAGPITMEPLSRRTIRAGDLDNLGNTDFAIQVISEDPVVAERAMYWTGGPPATEEHHREACHASIGLSSRHQAFFLPDGQSTGGWETWTTVSNPNPGAVTVEITYLPQGGGEPLAFTDTLPPGTRRSYTMEGVAGSYPGFSGRASILVVSHDRSRLIIAERSMYNYDRGAGTCTVGGVADW